MTLTVFSIVVIIESNNYNISSLSQKTTILIPKLKKRDARYTYR